MSELKSCPFCNAPDEATFFAVERDESEASEYVDPKGWLDGNGNTGPECLGCGATAPSIEAWNTRAPQQPQPANDRTEELLAATLRREFAQAVKIEELKHEIQLLKAQAAAVEWVPVQVRACIKPTHEAADAFWKYWRENGETHTHGYYESTWGAINAALAFGHTNPSAVVAIPEGMALVPDMFWNRDDSSQNYDSIDELVNHAWEQGAEIGCEFTVQCAASLPDVRVRLLSSGNGPDDVNGETTYELLSAAQSQGDAG